MKAEAITLDIHTNLKELQMKDKNRSTIDIDIAREIYKYLDSKIELPEFVQSLTLKLEHNEPAQITVISFAVKKQDV